MGRRVSPRKPKGAGANYLSRAQALKKSQLLLTEFRQLCILKGVYPREPKKKIRGKRNATLYHSKDISCLIHDPLMPIFRSEKAHQKRIRKAIGRKELSTARWYTKTKPKYTLHHIVKERYPTLLDALRDLDDPISLIALFSSLPGDETKGLKEKHIAGSVKLLDEFHCLVAQRGWLSGVFASIKGFYFRAVVLGQSVTWLVPHQYSQGLPYEVDFRVLATFYELYSCVITFVLFKLFAMENLAYPPQIDKVLARRGCRHLALTLNPISALATPLPRGETDDPMESATTAEDESAASNLNDVSMEGLPSQKLYPTLKRFGKPIFGELIVFVSREVPLTPLSLVLVSGGAKLGWDNERSPLAMEDPTVTHQIVDRSAEQMEAVYSGFHDLPPRTFVQPQWVLDSFNNQVLLPTEPYAPGIRPPPHLSPFVDDAQIGYIPKQREVLDALVAEKKNRKKSHSPTKGAADDDVESDVDSDEDAVVQMENIATAQRHQDEIEKELSGKWFSHEATTGGPQKEVSEVATKLVEESGKLSKSDRKKRKEKDEIARRASMLSNRKRRLYEKLSAKPTHKVPGRAEV